MEWNHFWPRCIFGDWPVGQWLTLKQHAIATALQTLAFQRNCMFATHKSYLPLKLLELSWPYYCEASIKSGKKGAMAGHKEKDKAGKSLHGKKCAAAAAAVRSKKVLVTFPDGSQRSFSSIKETGSYLGVSDVAVLYRLKDGPPSRKSKLFGYIFEHA